MASVRKALHCGLGGERVSEMSIHKQSDAAYGVWYDRPRDCGGSYIRDAFTQPVRGATMQRSSPSQCGNRLRRFSDKILSLFVIHQ